MAAGDRTGHQPAASVVEMLFENPALRAVEDRDLHRRPLGRVADRVDPEAVVRQHRQLLRQAAVELDDAQSLDQPARLERRHLPGLAGGELIVAAVVNRRRLAALHPEPEQFVVAAQIELGPDEAGGPQAKLLRPLEGDARRERWKPAAADRGVVGRERLNLRAVPIHHVDDLFQRRRRRGGKTRGSGLVYCCKKCGQLAPLRENRPVTISNNQRSWYVE